MKETASFNVSTSLGGGGGFEMKNAYIGTPNQHQQPKGK